MNAKRSQYMLIHDGLRFVRQMSAKLMKHKCLAGRLVIIREHALHDVFDLWQVAILPSYRVEQPCDRIMDMIEPIRSKHSFFSEDACILHALDIRPAEIKSDLREKFHLHSIGKRDSIGT